MSNRLTKTEVISTFTSLVRDSEEICDLPPGSLDGCLKTIIRCIHDDLENFVLLKLPELCSALDHAIGGWWNREVHTDRLIYRDGYPIILRPLFDLIFDAHGNPRPGAAKAVLCFRQITKIYKKYRINCPKERVTDAQSEFQSIEARLIEPLCNWGATDFDYSRGYPHLVGVGIRVSELSAGAIRDSWDDTRNLFGDLEVIQTIADGITRSFSIDKSRFRPKHGPGAVSEKFRESKYEFPSWPERLECRFPYDKYGILNSTHYSEEEWVSKEDVPAKLIAVPKSFKGPRLIASEPISAQYIQQGIMREIRSCLVRTPLRHCIDFRSQVRSQELALKASRSGGYSTIDLSSASDRLSCAVVECIFRRQLGFLMDLNAARTDRITLFDGSVLRMKKFAAQGAAFTFPVQSIVYAIICVGVLKALNPSSRLTDLCKEVRVYGDDMIVPTYCFDRIVKVLERLQLRVNPEKSFNSGLFRESCGMDAYWGTDVTPASILTHYNPKDRVNSVVSVIECSNNLYRKGFIRTSLTQQETIPMGIQRRFPWVSHDSTTLGFLGHGDNRHLRCRHNQYWCVDEVQIFVVDAKVTKTSPEWQHRLLQWFDEEPNPESKWRPGHPVTVKARYRLMWVPRHRLGQGRG